MPQPGHISKLGIPPEEGLPDDLKAIWAKCIEKIGFVPNVYKTLGLKPQRLRDFMQLFRCRKSMWSYARASSTSSAASFATSSCVFPLMPLIIIVS